MPKFKGRAAKGEGSRPRFSISVPPDVYDEIRRRADDEELSVAYIVRRAVKQYLAKSQKGRTPR